MKLGLRLQQWWISRLLPRDEWVLTHRNVYILPTSAGWMMGLTLLILLVASINYQLNLGYLLTFVLLGNVVVGMHICHGNLRGLTLRVRTQGSVHAGNSQEFLLELHNPASRRRFALGAAIHPLDGSVGQPVWTYSDVVAHEVEPVSLRFTPSHRGWHPVPVLLLQTLYPLGTFRVWTVWRPSQQVLVYPALEDQPPPLPGPAWQGEEGDAPARGHKLDELDGVREYRQGDPMKRIVWRKAAKSDQWVSRDSADASQAPLWLNWATTGAMGMEARVSRLAAWVHQADEAGLEFGLRLPGLEIAPSSGQAHRLRCMEALALC